MANYSCKSFPNV